ncbi:MAG: HAD family hydrolase [Chloroflexi bacterium]|nr:HAD family hydrolase [Chloroflexota bacterium]
MTIRALIFDFDGLILDTEGAIFQSWQELYQAHGGYMPISAWIGVIGTIANERDHFELLEEQIGRGVDRAALSPQRLQRELDLLETELPRPGVVECLEAARRMGLKLGVASSSPSRWVNGHLNRLGLSGYFGVVRSRDDVRFPKPEPDLYLSAAADLGVSPQEAIAIEDSPIGVTAAQRAGIFCVAVPNSLTAQMDLSHADLHLESLAGVSLEALIAQVQTLSEKR